MESQDSKKRIHSEMIETDNSTLAETVPTDVIRFEVITNDGNEDHSIKLMALKNIFSRQLPKMPREYIVRLVFDKRHFSLAILRNDKPIGGICYRPYYEQRFGEIAFCAINTDEQIKGYGTLLMNQLKHHVQKQKLEYFLTYADNFAIGYFQKQGFSKQISMPKDRWVGFIKDYDGGTLMECYIHPGIDYLSVQTIIDKQRNFLYDRINRRNSMGIYNIVPGLGSNLLEYPGVVEAGWSSITVYRNSTERDRYLGQNKLNNSLKNIMDKVFGKMKGNAFTNHLFLLQSNDNEGMVKIMDRLRSGEYYRCAEAMGADLIRMIAATSKLYVDDKERTAILKDLISFIEELFKFEYTKVIQSNINLPIHEVKLFKK